MMEGLTVVLALCNLEFNRLTHYYTLFDRPTPKASVQRVCNYILEGLICSLVVMTLTA